MCVLAFPSLKENASSREVASWEFRPAPGHPKALVAGILTQLDSKASDYLENQKSCSQQSQDKSPEKCFVNRSTVR